MAVNPLGYVCPMDGENPRIITGKAIEGILPGYIVSWSGASAAIGSDTSSFAPSDLWVHVLGSGLACGGVAIGSAASGGYVGVATRGAVIMTAGTTVTNGTMVAAVGDHCVITAATAGHTIGRAISNAGSEGYALIHLGGLL